MYRIDIIHKFRKLYAIIGDDQLIIMRSLNRDLLAKVAFTLNNWHESVTILKFVLDEEFSCTALKDTADKLRDSLNKTHYRPF